MNSGLMDPISKDTTQVVNVKVKYIRPKYKDIKTWMENPENVYIARAGVVFVKKEDGSQERWPKKNSVFANPYKVKKNADGSNNRLNIIGLYEDHIINKIESENLYDELRNLKGKSLGCWCKESDKEVECHGDVLVKLLERLERTGSIIE